VRRIWAVLLLVGGLAVGVPGVNAGPITVDGFLTDWVSGATLNTGYDLGAGALVPVSGVTYWIEDSVVDPYGMVGPGYGGQNFDVEAAYGIWSAGTYYGAFVTGFDQLGQYGWNGTTYYRTGDLFLDVNPGIAPGWDLAIAMSTHDGFVAGNVYAATGGTWYTVPTDFASSQPALLTGTPNDVTASYAVVYGYGEGMTTEINKASASYADYGAADHNVYEVSLAGGLLSGADSILMHYTQECGNDVFDLEVVDLLPPQVVPEPCTSVLALTALLAGVYVRRRKRRLPHDQGDPE
jgi:hypothetical protein